MFCRYCGAKLEDGDLFCQNCGSPTSEKKQSGEQEATDPEKDRHVNDSAQSGEKNAGNENSAQNKAANQQTSQAAQSAVPNPQAKSKLAAGLLGIFLGYLGVHNFYLGYVGRGLVQLLVSLLTFGIGVLPMTIWSLIEGIFYLTGKTGYTADAKGIPLTD
ncbi:MAG: zinc-ribbon domain and TM2 domain-containing protein [Eubacteriales bacterium]